MSKLKTISYYVFGLLYCIAGILHFVMPEFYLQIMPPYLPFHLELVYLSGVAEIVLGIGLVFKVSRQWAAYGIIALLIAVFPANWYLAFNETPQDALGTSQIVALWFRFPIQALLIGLAWWQSKVE